MSWDRPATVRPHEDPSGLELEVDPALIEAALEAVDRRMKPRGVEIDVEFPVEPGGREDEFVVPPELEGLLEAPAPDPPRSGDPALRSGEARPRSGDSFARSGGAARSTGSSHGGSGARAAMSPPMAPPEPGPDAALLAELRLREGRIELLTREVHQLRDARTALEGQLAEVRAGASQLYADMERMRARARKEREDVERAAEERVLEHLLDAVDNLERALGTAGAAEQPIARGLRMVIDQLSGRMRKLGLERVGAAPGDAFDPQHHDALQRLVVADLPAGSIAGQISAGYRYRGKLLRAARVAVVAGAPPVADPPPPVETVAEPPPDVPPDAPPPTEPPEFE